MQKESLILQKPFFDFKAWTAYTVAGGILGFFLALALADYATLHYQLIGLGIGISLKANELVFIALTSAIVFTAIIFKKFTVGSIVPLAIGWFVALLLNSISLTAGKDLELWPPTLSEWLQALVEATPGNIIYGVFIILVGYFLSKAVDWVLLRWPTGRHTKPGNQG